MILWLDAQLSPALAEWMTTTFAVEVLSVRDLSLREAEDLQIFEAARDAASVVMTKDSDFVELVERLGPPPQVLWITCGNTSNARLKQILNSCFPDALRLIQQGEPVVEIHEVT